LKIKSGRILISGAFLSRFISGRSRRHSYRQRGNGVIRGSLQAAVLG
jgi:hypothetical protein